MSNNFLKFVFAALALVLGGALEELCPKFAGVGFPVLLAAVQFMAARRKMLDMAAFAIVAGAMEDALSSLPMMTSVSYFLAVAALTRRLDVPRAAIVLTYPIYQIWLRLWVPALQGNVFSRALVALPVGLVAAFAVGAALAWAERRAALESRE